VKKSGPELPKSGAVFFYSANFIPKVWQNQRSANQHIMKLKEKVWKKII
jgi:hypothetical protein